MPPTQHGTIDDVGQGMMPFCLTRVLPALLCLGLAAAASGQVGSGAPDASGPAQRLSKSSTATPENAQTDDLSKMRGQALDQDAAVLSTVPPDPLFHRDPLRWGMVPFDATFNGLQRKEGITFAGSYTLLDQYATKTPDGVRHNAGTGRFDLVGGWKAYDHGGNAGSFSMLVRSGTNIGVSEQFNLSNALGSGLVLNCLQGGAAQDTISLNILYYRQDFYKRKFAFYIGKLHPNEFISLSLYNNDERSQFLNAQNDGNLTIASDGTYAGGAALEYQVTQHFYIHTVTVDTEGGEQRNLRSLADKKYMNAVEFGWKSGAPTRQEHLFRLALWRDDTAHLGSGAGAGFGSDYELKSGWVPFGRLGVATDSGTSIKRVFDAGVAHIRPFGRRGDMFGASINITDPSHGAKHHESLFETFYRVRVTRSFEAGPDLEISIHPTNSPNAYVTALLGMRVKLIL
ncbi:carbohydrate porin [Granulicella tundricola]|uniref:Carbohydrate-selective porin OprB n=1 Tax=Granulicella tundricola (strain ATCC BAA-1859 / DSM 23138 / MP5ACTX9) TaxID=1198114 RepID=E8WX89_GRATM|nr:carbohydrate porin [Granulicella tundricola]ADW69731.1 Carbohydrate-selective porin OprB [Granulicella tundricola MP5ACTX9]